MNHNPMDSSNRFCLAEQRSNSLRRQRSWRRKAAVQQPQHDSDDHQPQQQQSVDVAAQQSSRRKQAQLLQKQRSWRNSFSGLLRLSSRNLNSNNSLASSSAHGDQSSSGAFSEHGSGEFRREKNRGMKTLSSSPSSSSSTADSAAIIAKQQPLPAVMETSYTSTGGTKRPLPGILRNPQRSSFQSPSRDNSAESFGKRLGTLRRRLSGGEGTGSGGFGNIISNSGSALNSSTHKRRVQFADDVVYNEKHAVVCPKDAANARWQASGSGSSSSSSSSGKTTTAGSSAGLGGRMMRKSSQKKRGERSLSSRNLDRPKERGLVRSNSAGSKSLTATTFQPPRMPSRQQSARNLSAAAAVPAAAFRRFLDLAPDSTNNANDKNNKTKANNDMVKERGIERTNSSDSTKSTSSLSSFQQPPRMPSRQQSVRQLKNDSSVSKNSATNTAASPRQAQSVTSSTSEPQQTTRQARDRCSSDSDLISITAPTSPSISPTRLPPRMPSRQQSTRRFISV